MNELSDNHTHFTGSLPTEFILNLARKRRQPLGEQESKTWQTVFPELSYQECLDTPPSDEEYCQELFTQQLAQAFSGDYAQNITTFFDLYSLIQFLTKATRAEHMHDLYVEGTRAITKAFRSQGVGKFEIIAGPLADWDATHVRIASMIEGLDNKDGTEGSPMGRIRLTYISDSSANYTNFSLSVLKEIANKVECDPLWEDRLAGFDFSGTERTSNISMQRAIITHIREAYLQTGTQPRISVHAGEDMAHNSPEALLDYFDQLLQLEINRVCHGTFLWIPGHYIGLSQTEDKRRTGILEKMAEKDIELEICPTANVLLSPLHSYDDIPLQELGAIGVRYTINTDNPTLFSTAITQERQKVGLAA